MSEEDFEEHLPSSSEDRSLAECLYTHCPLCAKRFSRIQLFKHIRRTHGKSVVSDEALKKIGGLRCKRCGKIASSYRGLQRHQCDANLTDSGDDDDYLSHSESESSVDPAAPVFEKDKVYWQQRAACSTLRMRKTYLTTL
jgi:hypothetical protein